MQRVRQRALPVVVRRAQLLLIVLLPVLAARCAWLGGQIAADPFLPYSTPGRLPILVGGLLLIAAWGCLLASQRLTAPLLNTQTQGCGLFAPLPIFPPFVWVAGMLYMLRQRVERMADHWHTDKVING